MTIAEESAVRKSITVGTAPARAYEVFTDEFDTWWPRSHHIGTSPMTKAVIEAWVGGRCYSAQQDGTDCPWGQVLVWDPPRRLVIAWQITSEWGFEPDLAKSSEVEVTFTDIGHGQTRVDLEHRHFERMGPGGATMKAGVDAPGGWGSLLDTYADRVATAEAEQGQPSRRK